MAAKYTYYIVYFYRNPAEMVFGYGGTVAIRDNPIKSYADILEVAEDIKNEYGHEDLTIESYREIESDPITNYNLIARMSVEDMACYFQQIFHCTTSCLAAEMCNSYEMTGKKCYDVIRAWLEQEAAECLK